MKTRLALLAGLLAALPLIGSGRQPAPDDPQPVRFEHVDVFVDAGPTPLGAYQVEITGTPGRVLLVGIEGGEHAAFNGPPYYDPAALQHERVIIGAFSLADDLPTGRTRVARLHVQISCEGAPEYTVNLVTAATTGGTKIPATAGVGQGEEK